MTAQFEDHYSYRVSWSPEDEAFVGTVIELPALSWVDEDRDAAFRGIQRLVDEILADMLASGEQPPTAMADRVFSGRFVLRIPPELHRRLAMEAAEQHVSLNRLASMRLVG